MIWCQEQEGEQEGEEEEEEEQEGEQEQEQEEEGEEEQEQEGGQEGEEGEEQEGGIVFVAIGQWKWFGTFIENALHTFWSQNDKRVFGKPI